MAAPVGVTCSWLSGQPLERICRFGMPELASGPSTMLTIAALVHAGDLFTSCNRGELELMLKVFDSICSRTSMGMRVNAAKPW
jgi:hypothetical protein